MDRLSIAGHEVRAISRRPEALRGPVRGVDYRIADYRDKAALAAAPTGCDAVFHMISATTPGSGDIDPSLDVTENLLATLGLLDLMLDAGVGRLIYLSSGGMVYGPSGRVPVPESHALRPINSYGIVKVAIESYIELYSRTKGL